MKLLRYWKLHALDFVVVHVCLYSKTIFQIKAAEMLAMAVPGGDVKDKKMENKNHTSIYIYLEKNKNQRQDPNINCL